MLGPVAAILLGWTPETDLWKQNVQNTWLSIVHRINLCIIYRFFQVNKVKKRIDLWAEGINGHL